VWLRLGSSGAAKRVYTLTLPKHSPLEAARLVEAALELVAVLPAGPQRRQNPRKGGNIHTTALEVAS